jgi:hypothetical protein
MSDAAAAAAAAAATVPGAAATVPGAPGGTNGATPPWYAEADEITRGFFQNRGLDKKTAVEAAVQLAKDFRETQSKLAIPADRVLRVPEAADAEGWKAVHQRLGVPADPSQYDFTAVKFADGSAIDEELVTFARTTAHALNLPKDAAPQLAAAFVKFGEDAEAAEKVTNAAARAVAIDQLNTSWGANRATNQFIADRTASLLGLTPEFIAAVPADLYAGFMEKLREAGSRMGEAALLGHGASGGLVQTGPMTREGAMARIEELKRDPVWYKRWQSGDTAAQTEWNNLNRMAASSPR